MVNLVKSNPRMAFLLIGFFLGCIVAVVGVYSTMQSTDIYKEQITKLEREITISDYRYEELDKEHKELKTSFNETYEETIAVDGSKVIKRITNKETDEVTDKASESRTKLAQSHEKTAAHTAVRSSETKDFGLNLGIDTDMDVHIGMSYRVFPPFGFNFSVEIDPDTPNVIKSLQLGIGIRL